MAQSCSVTPDVLLKRQRRGSAGDARKLLLWAAKTYCVGRFSLEEIGRRLGGITHSAITRAHQDIETRRTLVPAVRERVQALIWAIEASTGSFVDDPWMEMYCRLQAHYQQYGHAHIPRHYPPDIALGAWVHRQRLARAGLAHTAQPLTPRQISARHSSVT